MLTRRIMASADIFDMVRASTSQMDGRVIFIDPSILQSIHVIHEKLPRLSPKIQSRKEILLLE